MSEKNKQFGMSDPDREERRFERDLGIDLGESDDDADFEEDLLSALKLNSAR